MKLFRQIIFTLLLLLYAGAKSNVFSDNTPYQIVKQLNQDWLVYSKKYSSYINYLPEFNKRIHTVNQWLEVEKYKNYQLCFDASHGLSLFADNRLIYENFADTSGMVYLNISDIPDKSINGKVLITFFSPDYLLPIHSSYIVCKKNGNFQSNLKSTGQKSHRRVRHSQHEYYIVLLVAMLILTALLKHMSPKHFVDFIGTKGVLINLLEEAPTIRVFSFSLIIVNLVISISLTIIIGICGGLPVLFTLLPAFLNPIILWNQIIVCILFFFFILIMKYYFISFMGWVFNLSDIIKIQYLEWMKGIIKINLIISLIAIIYSLNYQPNLVFGQVITYTLLAFLILIVLRNALLIIKLTPFRNIYLFSYLCTTEIMPLAIIIKIILFWNNSI
jgi:hypothetical protein